MDRDGLEQRVLDILVIREIKPGLGVRTTCVNDRMNPKWLMMLFDLPESCGTKHYWCHVCFIDREALGNTT